MASITTVKQLTDFGRTRLSKSFFMRDFLYSEIAAIHGLANLPSDPDLAIIAGTRLCEDLLEPLQDRFGRITIRSAYRSAEVNALGCQMQAAGKRAYSCASNESNYASHIWDRRDRNGCIGVTAASSSPHSLTSSGTQVTGRSSPGGSTILFHTRTSSSSRSIGRSTSHGTSGRSGGSTAMLRRGDV